jgi:hypothetical protein
MGVTMKLDGRRGLRGKAVRQIRTAGTPPPPALHPTATATIATGTSTSSNPGTTGVAAALTTTANSATFTEAAANVSVSAHAGAGRFTSQGSSTPSNLELCHHTDGAATPKANVGAGKFTSLDNLAFDGEVRCSCIVRDQSAFD